MISIQLKWTTVWLSNLIVSYYHTLYSKTILKYIFQRLFNIRVRNGLPTHRRSNECSEGYKVILGMMKKLLLNQFWFESNNLRKIR